MEPKGVKNRQAGKEVGREGSISAGRDGESGREATQDPLTKLADEGKGLGAVL